MTLYPEDFWYLDKPCAHGVPLTASCKECEAGTQALFKGKVVDLGGGDAVPTMCKHGKTGACVECFQAQVKAKQQKHSKVDTTGFWDFGANRLDTLTMREHVKQLRQEREALRSIVEQLRNEIANLKAKIARRDRKIAKLSKTSTGFTTPHVLAPKHDTAPQRAPIGED